MTKLDCGHTGVDWDNKGNCITCARDIILGEPQSTPLNRESIHMAMLAKSESAKELGELTAVLLGHAVTVAEELINERLQAFAKEVEDEVIGDGKNDSVHNYNAHETKEIFRIEQRQSLDNLIDKWTGVEDE